VRAASVNPIDWKRLAGVMSGGQPLAGPEYLGNDAAGVVDEVVSTVIVAVVLSLQALLGTIRRKTGTQLRVLIRKIFSAGPRLPHAARSSNSSAVTWPQAAAWRTGRDRLRTTARRQDGYPVLPAVWTA
jgi:NADPH:quinone reductase-like Zn-dependent oxidoreductase